MSIKIEIIKVYGMTCTSCEKVVEKALNKVPGVVNTMASYSDQQVTIEYDSEICNMEQLKEVINKAGYSTKSSSTIKLAGFLVIAVAVLLLGNSTAGFDMSAKLNNASYVVLFVVGMLTSIHCVGMCGGIMLTQSLSKNSIVKENQRKFKTLIPAILYNAGRVTSYTIIGGIVGALGSVLSLSLNVKAGLQILAGIFMVIMGLNMAGFSIFRKFNIKLPWSSCTVKNKPKTPFLVGMLNGLMPCGPLQTMQLYALGTGSAIGGALSMFVFSLGTVPLMLVFGAISGLLSKGYTKQLLKFSGILVVVLGIIMGNRGLALAGVGGLPSMMSTLRQSLSGSEVQASTSNIAKPIIENGVQIIKMTADSNGYTPNAFYVQKGMPVKWIISGDKLNACNNAVVVPSLNIEKKLVSGENVIEFTPQDKDINFSCWMGMIRGVIKVTDNLDSIDTSKADSSIPAPSSGMSCCTGGDTGTTSPQTPSIYGDDLSKVSTDRLIKKANISEDVQNLNIKGTGYEFEPLVIVLEKGIKTNLSIDLSEFDDVNGTFDILDAESNKQITSFIGKKGIVNVDFKIDTSGTYLIVKNEGILAGIEVTDSLKTVNLEDVRKKFINE